MNRTATDLLYLQTAHENLGQAFCGFSAAERSCRQNRISGRARGLHAKAQRSSQQER